MPFYLRIILAVVAVLIMAFVLRMKEARAEVFFASSAVAPLMTSAVTPAAK